MKNAVIYTRVSSAEQIDNTSLDSQDKTCRECASMKEFNVLKTFREEGESAKMANRPKLNEMLAFCSNPKNQVDAVIVYKIDRLARNLIDFYKLIEILAKANIAFLSATEPVDTTPIGKAMQGMLAVFAEFDNSIKADRTKQALKSIIENERRYPHKAPIGYLNVETHEGKRDVIPDPNIAPLVSLAFQQYASGHYTLGEIASIFSSQHIIGARKGKIGNQFVRKMLVNELYISEKYEYGSERIHVTFDHEPLIDRQTFLVVQEQLKKRSNNSDHPRTLLSEDFPLRQFVRCHTCSGYMTGYYATGRHGKKFGYYRCYNKECDNKKSFPKSDIHKHFLAHLEETIPKGKKIESFKEAFIREWNKLQTEATNSTHYLEKELLQLQTEKEQVLKLARQEILSPDEAKEEMEKLRNKILVAEIALNDAKTDQVEAEVVLTEAINLFRNIPKVWQLSDISDKRKIQGHLFPEGLIYDGTVISNRCLSPAIKAINEFTTNEDRMG